jgi:hypothetical protein
MDPALQTMLTQTVSHQPYTGQDVYGKPTYGAVVEHPALIEYRITTGGQGQQAERVSVTVVYCEANFPLTVRDRLVLPDGTAPAIQDVQSWPDPTQPGSTDHYEIVL